MVSERQLQKVAEGREAEMFAWEDGKILRLLRPGFNAASLEAEVRALELAHRSGIPVPTPGQRVTVDGRSGVVLERIEGTDLLTELGRAPWLVLRAGRICGAVHAQINACRVEDGELQTLKGRLELKLASPLVPPELAAIAGKRLAALPDGDALCHYDFHPANVMRRPAGPVVIDWANAALGPAEADVARTLLLLRTGEPASYPLVMRVLTTLGRRLFVQVYLGSYRRARPLEMREVEKWALPIAVARLAENIEEERSSLLKRIERLRASA